MSEMRRHINPDGSEGGLVSVCSTVNADCWVSKASRVDSGSRVIRGSHVAGGSYVVSGSYVNGSHVVGGSYVNGSTVNGSHVEGGSTVVGGSHVSGSHVSGRSTIEGGSTVVGGSTVRGAAIRGGHVEETLDVVSVPIAGKHQATLHRDRDGHWVVQAGCKTVTIEEARAAIDAGPPPDDWDWGDDADQLRARYTAILDMFEAIVAAREGDR